MRKLVSILAFVLLFAISLTSCGLQVPRPEIKSGKFDFTVTYELNGEVKTLNSVYTCEYAGVGCTLEGKYYRVWEGDFDGDFNDEVIEVCTNDDGGEISLCFLIYPEYFMGEPDYDDFYPVLTPTLIYYEGENGTISEMFDDPKLLADYGVRIISVEYDEPIKNSFN